MNNIIKVKLYITLIFILYSCSASTDSVEKVRTNQFPEIQLFHQTTIQDSDSFPFRFISAISSDNDETIFLADPPSHSIYVFDMHGNFKQNIGREGSGPGEFRSILSMFMDYNQRLFVNDISSNRTNVFAESDGQWTLTHEYSSGSHRFSVISATPSGKLGLRKSPFQQPSQGAYWYEHELGSGDLFSNTVQSNLLSFKERGQLVHESGSMIGIPFGRETLVASDVYGQIYLIWTESFNVVVYDSQINPIDSISARLPNFEVTHQDREYYFNRLSTIFYSLAERFMPVTKPVIRQLIVDPNGNLWVQTYDSPEYLVLNNVGLGIGSFDLTNDETLMHVDGQRLYTKIVDKTGTRVLVYTYMINK